MAQALFDDGSSDSEAEFSVSNKYAEKYNSWREKEEYQKLQAKYGKDVSLDAAKGADETSSSSEDEEAEELTPNMEKQFFETLSKLKQNDPEIYDPGKRFFNEKNEENGASTSKKKRKEKPMFLRDYEREMLLNSGEVQNENGNAAGPPEQPSYAEEQEELRAGFRALVDSDSDGEEGGDPFSGSLLKKREKTAAEQEHEDEEYKIWLKGQKDTAGDKAVEGRLKGLKDAWSNPKISKDEAFLRDYILSKRYLEEGDDSYVPSYEEVVHDSEGDLSEDERTVGKQEAFEHKFNFRFEEPDQEFIKRYPRTIKNSLRKKDERRKLNREEKRKRQEEEKKKKEEELKRLKTLKRKEIMEKLETLKEAVGNTDLPFEVADLDADFDPDAHDRKMGEMFGDDYYYDADNDEEKPVFSDDEDWDNWAPGEEDAGEGEEEESGQWAEPGRSQSDHTPACEQPDFVMDCDYTPSAVRRPPAELTTGRGRKKRRGRLAELLRRKKPRFEPAAGQRLAEYVDQYYQLDAQANPHPFKYREVPANDFGLDTTEILMADERDLNRWVSVKRMSQYLRPEEEQHDVKKYKAKASNAFYKQKILQSLYKKEGEPEEDPENYEPQKKKKKKRKRKEKEREAEEQNGGTHGEGGEEEEGAESAALENGVETAPDAAESEPQEQGKKKKKKKRKEKLAATEETTNENGTLDHSAVNGEQAASENPPEGGKKKKKKRKHPEETADDAAEQRPGKTRSDEPAGTSEGPAPKKRRHAAGGKRRRAAQAEAGSQAAMVLSMSDARLEAFGLNPKKIRGKVIYGQGGS
ncbi:protein KRI1 homolog isoform X1 [Amphibalanus amphitrite]|uniref:protein KRI1 homolog isoform X1 n=1 Tax=Amphibalanus amphitrite TaxID=1232801 RepID=UPI001C92031F|nr:protein KRI1 homolog isoform X1 [Amphibalanus amphitrite]